jgi:hypothetical protein
VAVARPLRTLCEIAARDDVRRVSPALNSLECADLSALGRSRPVAAMRGIEWLPKSCRRAAEKSRDKSPHSKELPHFKESRGSEGRY